MSVLPGETLICHISPIKKTQVQPAGVDLTVGEIYVFNEGGFLGVEKVDIPEYSKVKCENGVFKLSRGAYLVRFNEVVEIPEDCVAVFLPRSSLLRMGATIASALWDPGYRGRGVGLLLVFNEHGIRIEKNARIAQIFYIRMEKKPGKTYSGRYQLEGVE